MPGIDQNTKLLLHMDGTDGSTIFIDSSNFSHSVTSNGNAQIDTAQSKFGGTSALFITSDYLSILNNSDFEFGTGDFTIDTWVNLSVKTGGTQNIFAYSTSANGNVQFFWSDPFFGIFTNAEGTFISTSGHATINTGQWYHVAWVRQNDIWNIFIDGVSYATETNSVNLGIP
ncbi:MAG: LamG domain-containing protein, partial [Bacteroidetes bacterium]|nr:LamG domain-containing protein [Bacteroidota bacterium]